MKFISVVGARPQFIKLGPLSREMRKVHQEIIIHTGQHYDNEMSGLFFEELNIPKPDINLEVGSGQHGAQTGAMLKGIESQIIHHKPDLVLSFGDTNSTLAACLAASKLNVPSLHIEAGLRSFNRSMPEEINRVIADHTADLLFAPTPEAVKHLENEGLKERTRLSGDIMVDTFDYVHNTILNEYIPESDYYLLTLHRPYTVDSPKKLQLLLNSLGELQYEIKFPVHPRTKQIIEKNHINVPKNFSLLPPLGYLEFQQLLKGSLKVITDSGGLQKEAYLAGKPCITVRPETEWIETVTAGWNILLDINDKNIPEKISGFNPNKKRPALYGKNVAPLMRKLIEKSFNTK